MKNLINRILCLVLLSILFLSCASDDGGDESSEKQEETPSTVYAFTYNNKNYEIIKEKKTWEQAATDAVNRGGYLAEINGSGENTAIFSAASAKASIDFSKTAAFDGGDASYIWIGGNDLSSEGRWAWDGNNDSSSIQFWEGGVNGEAINDLYNNWGNEPDNFNGSQHGLALALTQWPIDTGTLGQSGQWNDLGAGNVLYFVVEYD